MDWNSFSNYVGQPVLLVLSISMAVVGIELNLVDAKTLLDFCLTLALKLVPIGTLALAYFANKDKIDANVKKTFSFRWFQFKRRIRKRRKDNS